MDSQEGFYGPTPEWSIACQRGMSEFEMPELPVVDPKTESEHISAENTWTIKP